LVVLPAEVGGSPTDYQLVESEDGIGRARLRLLVHPRVGELDEERVKDVFLRALSASGTASTVTGLVWRDAELVTVTRTEPRITGAGKIQHLHRVTADEAARVGQASPSTAESDYEVSPR
jgi:hypothetical protein